MPWTSQLFFLLCFVAFVVVSTQNSVTKSLTTILDALEKGALIKKVELGLEQVSFSDVYLKFNNFSKVLEDVNEFGFKLDMNADQVLLNGVYELKNIQIPENHPFLKKGNFQITFEDAYMKFYVDLNENKTAKKIELDIFGFEMSVKNSTVNIENNLKDKELSTFLNTFLSAIIPEVVKIFSDSGVQVIQPFLERAANKAYISRNMTMPSTT